MFDHTTIIKRARDILVGKVPMAMDQCHEITKALIYKFISNSDKNSQEIGGEPFYFTGSTEQCRWDNLMDMSQTADGMQKLYFNGLNHIGNRNDIPEAFRAIYYGSYIPNIDAPTLREFLRTVDLFSTANTESIGDAFEHLLQDTGAQGNAGQFRTPRHIIDFIVSIINPRKDETILDPACGTAGFLASSYQHICQHASDRLSSMDKQRIATNLVGYDISPDMVKLATIHMFLQHNQSPPIRIYDTISDDTLWNDHYDVILANPPFMTPKGVIKPNSRFYTRASKSEVLFVDYIISHLNEQGRAGVIVPEGIIFRQDTAYRQLRRLLIDNCLVAVISLPLGVFQPYSNVKTSILIMNKELARFTDNIAFFKVENVGWSLGAKPQSIKANDLPMAVTETAEYLRRLQYREAMDDFNPHLGTLVAKDRIASDVEYNLAMERYTEIKVQETMYPVVFMNEICEFVRGVTYKKSDEVENNGYQILRANNIDRKTSSLDLTEIKQISQSIQLDDSQKLQYRDIFICAASGSKEHVGKVALINKQSEFYFGGFMGAIRSNRKKVEPAFLFYHLRHKRFNDFLRRRIVGASINNLSAKIFYEYQIPLPPLEIQQKIIAEVDRYQRVIDGLQSAIDSYRPKIDVALDWIVQKVGDIVNTVTPPTKIQSKDFGEIGNYPIIDQSQNPISGYTDDESALIDGRKGMVIFGDHTCAVKFMDTHFAQGADGIKILTTQEILIPKFLYYYLLSYPLKADGYRRHFRKLKDSTIAIPPLATQQDIVDELDAEQTDIDHAKDLVDRMRTKIDIAVDYVWNSSQSVLEETTKG